MRGQVDLERVSVATVICAIVAAVVPWETVRVIATLPLAFFLPGYSITAAAFGPRRLDLPQLLMLSLALSLMVITLGGLLLNYLPGGLRTITWAILIVAVVLAGSRGAALRRAGERWTWPAAAPRLRRSDLLYGGCAVIVAVAALVLAYTPLPAGDATGSTSLWMLPARGSGPPAVRVGAKSSEQSGVALRLDVSLDGKRLERHRLVLEPGEQRLFRVPLEGAEVPGRHHVIASLFREADPHTLYRRVTRWLAGERIRE